MNLLLGIIQALMVLMLAPFFAGFIHKLKQRIRGQKGISVFQLYRNLYKLHKKEIVLSKDASLVSRLAPYFYFLPHALLCFMLPFFYESPLLGNSSNPVVLLYLLSLSIFFMTLYALDQASSFGALGSSREWFISSLSEPSAILLLFSLCIYTGEFNLSHAFLTLSNELRSFFSEHPSHFSISIPFLLLFTLLILTLAENARIPFDNPETHLELTMVHEANILEASGPHLLLFEYGSYLRLTLFLSIMSILIFPFIGDSTFYPLAFALYLLKMLFLCILIAFVESFNAKMRLFRIPNVLSFAFVLSLLTLILSMEA